jgi:hypothetical protein
MTKDEKVKQLVLLSSFLAKDTKMSKNHYKIIRTKTSILMKELGFTK